MKPTLQASLICEDFAQKPNGNLVLFGLYRDIQSPAFPVVHRLIVANIWVYGEGSFTERLQIVATDRETILIEAHPIQFTLADTARACTNIHQLFIEIREEGMIWIKVLLDNEQVLEYPLNVFRLVPKRSTIGEGDLVKGSGPHIYVIEKGKRRHIPNPETFNAMGFRWSNVKWIPDEQLAEISEGDPLAAV